VILSIRVVRSIDERFRYGNTPFECRKDGRTDYGLLLSSSADVVISVGKQKTKCEPFLIYNEKHSCEWKYLHYYRDATFVANRSARDIAEAPADIGSGDIRDPARKETNAQVDQQALCEQGLDVIGRDTVIGVRAPKSPTAGGCSCKARFRIVRRACGIKRSEQ
jgi:hypothetical protein